MMITAMTVRRQQHGTGCQEEEEEEENQRFSPFRLLAHISVCELQWRSVLAHRKKGWMMKVCAGDDEANQEAGAR